MARKGYSARQFAGGFQPVQLSDGQIKRMSDDSQRVISNMERLRKIELQRGLETLDAMKKNSAAEQQQLARNFEIIQQNAQVKSLELQFERKKAEQETGLARQAQAASSAGLGDFLGGFSQLLAGAGKLGDAVASIQQRAEVEQEKDRQFAQTLEFMTLSEQEQNDPEFQAMEQGLRIAGLKYSQNLSLSEANQGDPNAIARAREANPANRYASKKSAANWMLINKFESYLNNILSDTNNPFEWNGQQVTFASARVNPRLMSVVQRFAFKQFLEENNLNLDRRYVKDGLNHVQKLFKANENRASQIEIENSYARQEQVAFSTLRNNPQEFKENIANAFNTWKINPNLGFKGAHKNYMSLATDLNPDGSFRFEMSDLLEAKFTGSGKSYQEEWDGNAAQMIAARAQVYIQQENRQKAVEKIKYRNQLDEAIIFLSQPGNNTQANVLKVKEAFDSQWMHLGGAGSIVNRMAESGTIEAKTKLRLTKQLREIPPDFLTFEDVQAAYSTDPTLGAEIDKRYQSKNSIESNEQFKTTIKIFKTFANGETAFGTNKNDTDASARLQLGMREDFIKGVKQRLKGQEPLESAILAERARVIDAATNGKNVENSKYYRKIGGPGGAASYPNLVLGAVQAGEAFQRKRSFVNNELDPKNKNGKGLNYLLDTPGALLSQEQANEAYRTYGTSEFKVDPIVSYISHKTNSDPFVVYNRVWSAMGLKPKPVPAAFTSVQKSASPELIKLLQKVGGANISTRAMGAANAFNPRQMPNQLGPVVQQFAQSLGVSESATAAFVQNSGSKPGKALTLFGQNMQTMTNAGDAALIALSQSGEYSPAQIKKAYQNFIKHHYAYGGGPQALNQSGLMRQGSPMRSMYEPLRQYSSQVSSITFDTGEPGIDVFFEDKKMPAVLPGIVKDISYQGTGNTGYGNYLIVESIDPDTGEKVDVLYSHLAVPPNLTPGQMIQTGQIIGQQGGTGRVVSADGTIASIDFLRPAPAGSKDMTPYRDFDNLRRRIASTLSKR